MLWPIPLWVPLVSPLLTSFQHVPTLLCIARRPTLGTVFEAMSRTGGFVKDAGDCFYSVLRRNAKGESGEALLGKFAGKRRVRVRDKEDNDGRPRSSFCSQHSLPFPPSSMDHLLVCWSSIYRARRGRSVFTIISTLQHLVCSLKIKLPQCCKSCDSNSTAPCLQMQMQMHLLHLRLHIHQQTKALRHYRRAR